MNINVGADHRKFPASITTVVPGVLYAVGASVELDRPLWFMSPQARGWLPIQCHVLVDGDQLMLIDTGLSAHKEQISAGLTALFEGTAYRQQIATRREMVGFLNTEWIIPNLTINKMHFAGDINPLLFFETMDEANAERLLRAMSQVELNWLKPGMQIQVGRLTLTAVRPVVRLLASYWYYEPSLKTLFTSDFWAFVTRPQRTGPVVVRPTDDEISFDAIYGHLMAKFDWVRGIDSSPLIADLEAILDTYDVERVCPNYGAMIEGRENIRILRERTIEVLRAAGAEPRRSVLDGFQFPNLSRTRSAEGASGAGRTA